MEKFFVLFAAVCLLLAALFIVFILLSRLFKSARERKIKFLKSKFQDLLNPALFPDSEQTYSTESKQSMTELKQLTRGDNLAKQVLIDQMINSRKNLTGATAQLMEKLYQDLDLHNYSLNKLKSANWSKQAHGVRELTEMNYAGVIEFAKSLAKSKNLTLKEEVLMSSIRLNKENPLAFLNQYDGEITNWMRINAHHHIALMDPRQRPDFSKWLLSSKRDVVMFSISMIRHFRQTQSIGTLKELLTSNDPFILASTIRALGELDVLDCTPQIIKLIDTHWENEKVCSCIVRFLDRVGSEEDQLIIKKFLLHPSFQVKLDAVKALTRSGVLIETDQSKELETLVHHSTDPLLE